MALVSYSDSETSDVETPGPVSDPGAPKPSTTFSAQFVNSPKPASGNTSDASRGGPRRIKVQLSGLQAEAHTPSGEDAGDEPPVKRARTAGAFSGFNSLLPAPKRTAAQNAPKAGVSLKTSSEAAFSRNPLPTLNNEDEDGDTSGYDGGMGAGVPSEDGDKPEAEIKIVGKATKFKPLSVANKKKKPLMKTTRVEEVRREAPRGAITKSDIHDDKPVAVAKTKPPSPPKPKRSLFAAPQQEEADDLDTAPSIGTYESITTTYAEDDTKERQIQDSIPQIQSMTTGIANSSSLQSLTSDLNLTAAQKRQLFGRKANKDGADISIAHFNMDSEYAANEQLRQAGEVVEHRAVKAIAPGKHSLQQLVNNARSQQENLEDKWAAGRAARGTMR